jgi:hypothetical protein
MRVAQRSRKAIAGLGGIVCICALVVVGLPQSPAVEAHSPGASPAAPGRSTTSDYVGSDACSGCHSRIYREYKKTAMGQSMVPAGPDAISRLALPAHFTNSATNRNFDVFARNGKLYESEYAVGSDGRETFRDTRAIQWLIGAGVNGYGPMVEQDQYLFQAPLSYYTKPGSWGPSPGYESLDLGFNRPILTGCIFCHAGRANPVPATNGKYAQRPFSELSIGCENCHGPGAAHIRAMTAHPAAARDEHIVNPARLTPYLADNICMGCHQTGDVRALQPGKSYADVRPGRPLNDVLSIFIVPPTPQSPPDADHVEHYYSMTLSKCYRASAGRMSCLSCHDPHVEPSAAEAPAYYAHKCLACHTNQSCTIPLATRLHQQPANDCVHCHMPKRDIQVISHSTATNHRILAKPDEAWPDITFHQTTASLPDLIHLDPAPGEKDALPPPLMLLQVYGELAANNPRYISRYLDVLSALEKSMPNDPLMETAVGRRELKSGNYTSAATHLLHAVDLAPPQATTCADLADALAHLGRGEEAVSWLDKSIELDPFNPFTQRSLIVQLIRLKQYARVRTALEHYVQVFPQDTYMRRMLEMAPAQHD